MHHQSVPSKFITFLTAALLMVCVTTAVSAADATADQIAARAKAKFDAVTTLSVTVDVQMVDPSTNKPTKMGMAILADKAAGLSRMTFLSPPAFKGQVIIVDQKANVMKMYMPVTNQVVVTKLGKAGADGMGMGMGMGGMSFDPTAIMAISDTAAYDFKLLGREKVGTVEAYVLFMKEKKDAKTGGQKIWLALTDLTPLRLEFLGIGGKSSGTLEFKGFKSGLPIDRKKLTFLPARVEVIEG